MTFLPPPHAETRTTRRWTRLPDRFRRDRSGATAIEFALVAMPLFLTIFVILECALHYFVGTSLDMAVQRTSRQIRTGQVQALALDQAAFKSAVCHEMKDLFGCREKLRLKVDVVADVGDPTQSDPTDRDGNLVVEDSFNTGRSGDVLLVQAFLPWPAFARLVSLSGERTSEGDYILRSSTLFRNEPF
jgi:Flp pilus assembly protein TadG